MSNTEVQRHLSKDIDRRWIFLSHANPEDNAATIWFATQLANEGYWVWADVISLVGGENFWGGIEDVIRHRAAKVVFLLSPASNSKEGCDRELSVAQGVAKAEKLMDFVIPLRIADLSHNDASIRVHALNIIESRGWNLGLADLLEKLERDNVPRDAPRDFRATSAWWKARFATSQSLTRQSEILSSNWFRVTNPKLTIYRHTLGIHELTPIENTPFNFPWPTVTDSDGVWTFASATAFAAQLPAPIRINRTFMWDIMPGEFSEQAKRDAAYRLCLLAWHAELERRGLMKYELANKKFCFAFPKDLVSDDEIAFGPIEGRRRHRTVIGYKTRTNAKRESWKRFWHFAVQPIPAFSPEMIVMFKTHVLFSDDGKTLWTSETRVQKARRNQCKNWWNDTWRDRLHAVVSWLADEDGSIRLEVGASVPITVEAQSMSFESPLAYGQEGEDFPAQQLDDAAIDDIELESDDDSDEDEYRVDEGLNL